MREIAYIGIGTNIEPRMERMQAAIAALRTRGIVIRVSSIYESAPYGVVDQPAFLNAVVALTTTDEAQVLHARLKELEKHLGRMNRERWHEREIDFDILFYGNSTLELPNLIIPHADLLNRNFVLIPLREIAPNLIHPVMHKTIEELSFPFSSEQLQRI